MEMKTLHLLIQWMLFSFNLEGFHHGKVGLFRLGFLTLMLIFKRGAHIGAEKNLTEYDSGLLVDDQARL